MNRVIHSVRAEFGRWMEAESGTWRAQVGLSLLIGLLPLAALVRWLWDQLSL